MKDIKNLGKKLALGFTMATGVVAKDTDLQAGDDYRTLIEIGVLMVIALSYGCTKAMREDREMGRLMSMGGSNGQVRTRPRRRLRDDDSEITIVVDDNYETKTNISDITCVNPKEEVDITEQFEASHS